jgi:protein gp37
MKRSDQAAAARGLLEALARPAPTAREEPRGETRSINFLSVEPLLAPVNLRPWLRLLNGIDWVIVGGESGPRKRGESGRLARVCEISWLLDVVEQCKEAAVPVFVKQAGSRPVAASGNVIQLRSRKGGDLEELPVELRVREFPVPAWAA